MASADFSLRAVFDGRRPFRRKARSPQVSTVAFPAPSPDLRCFPLVAGASRPFARSPRSAAPPIRFLFVDPRVRSPLLSAPTSRWPAFRRFALRFARGPCDLVPQRTCTSASRHMLGTQKQRGPASSDRPPAKYDIAKDSLRSVDSLIRVVKEPDDRVRRGLTSWLQESQVRISDGLLPGRRLLAPALAQRGDSVLHQLLHARPDAAPDRVAEAEVMACSASVVTSE